MLLAIDVGSSSVKAAILDGVEIAGNVASASFATDYDGPRVEVPAERVDTALREAVAQLDLSNVERVGLTGMAPAWLAMADDGTALTPIVTHQDRRSLHQAHAIEHAIGRGRHLALAGNRPTPGGISSTTARWFATQTAILDKASVLGHLPTYLARRLTGEWTIDPSNAGFTGLMEVSTGTWSAELCDAANVPIGKLPPIRDAAGVIGLTRDNELGIPPGLPLIGGYVDGSGPLLVGGAEVGTLVHSAGSTDVIAVCVDVPRPTNGLLCRPLGVGGKWVYAATQAAGAAGLTWARETLFADLEREPFADAVRAAAERQTSVVFRPHLAGDRQSVDQPTGGFDGLTLSTTRDDLLAAIVRALIDDHADRLRRILRAAGDVSGDVITTGGGGALPGLLRAAWPSDATWRFREVDQATLRGLGTL